MSTLTSKTVTDSIETRRHQHQKRLHTKYGSKPRTTVF